MRKRAAILALMAAISLPTIALADSEQTLTAKNTVKANCVVKGNGSCVAGGKSTSGVRASNRRLTICINGVCTTTSSSTRTPPP